MEIFLENHGCDDSLQVAGCPHFWKDNKKYIAVLDSKGQVYLNRVLITEGERNDDVQLESYKPGVRYLDWAMNEKTENYILSGLKVNADESSSLWIKHLPHSFNERFST